jgi:hypothetical protein
MHAAASGRFQESEKILASGRSWPRLCENAPIWLTIE